MAGLTRVLSSTTIRPASGDGHANANQRMELTPSDLQTVGIEYVHRGLLFHRHEQNPVEHLKASLSQALDHVYPLAGRLVATEHGHADSKTVAFHVRCDGSGVKFVHAEAVGSFKMADILDPLALTKEAVGSLFPLNGVLNYQAAEADIPLLAVQVTEFTDGVFVAVSRNHCVADGSTFWDFVNVWSEITRGDSAAKRGDFVFDREYCFGRQVEFPIRIPLPRSKALVGTVPQVQLQYRVLRFQKERIAELKAKANAAEPGRVISSLQALLGHLWVSVTLSRALREDDPVCFRTMVGMRSRLQPPLPKNYVGNGTLPLVLTCTAGELVGRGMGWAARRINEAIAATCAMEAGEFFRSCADMSKRAPNLLLVAGSPRFNVYGNDFGWGRPLELRSGSAGAKDGFMSVSEGAVQGSIDFEVIFSADTLHALAEFM